MKVFQREQLVDVQLQPGDVAHGGEKMEIMMSPRAIDAAALAKLAKVHGVRFAFLGLDGATLPRSGPKPDVS
jgi:hypothetical protein